MGFGACEGQLLGHGTPKPTLMFDLGNRSSNLLAVKSRESWPLALPGRRDISPSQSRELRPSPHVPLSLLSPQMSKSGTLLVLCLE